MNGASDSGLVLGTGGRMNATLEFFYHANEDQMPVRGIAVDWGNGDDAYSSVSIQNSLANRRGLKPGSATDSFCDNSTFGQEKDRACLESSMVFPHVEYRCPVAQPSGMLSCGANGLPQDATASHSGCWDGAADNGRGACVFVPRVHIQDNWGWCTGDCPGGAPGGGQGCYDATGLGGGNACETTSTSAAWIPFKGRVVVTPP